MLKRAAAAISLALLLVLSGMIIGNENNASQPKANASTVFRKSIIEQSLRSVGMDLQEIEGNTRIYAVRAPISQIETWLRESEIRTAARVQGRPVDEVRLEWNGSGLGRLPDQVVSQYDTAWVIDVRGGVNYQVGTEIMPLTLPPEHLRPSGWQPPQYDNIHVILSVDGVQIGLGAFLDSASTPPLGSVVDLTRVYDDQYMIEISANHGNASEVRPSSTGTSKVFVPSVSIGSEIPSVQLISVIEHAMTLVDYQSMAVPGETTNVYVAHGPVAALETWLRDAAITQAADIQGRPIAEVRQEWDQAGITYLPNHILNNYEEIWFIDLRGGIRYVPGPITPPPGGVLPVYDNVHQVLDDTGVSLGLGTFSATSYWTPPFGELVLPGHWQDDEYMISIPSGL